MILYLRSLSDNPLPLPEAPAAEAAPAGQGGGRGAGRAAAASSRPLSRRRPRTSEQAAAVEAAQDRGRRAARPGAGGDSRSCSPRPTPTRAKARRESAPPATASRRAAPTRSGPTLWGVVGRDIASAEGFSYSSALGGQGGRLGLREPRPVPRQPEGVGAGHQDGLRRPQEGRRSGPRSSLYLRSLADRPAAAAGAAEPARAAAMAGRDAALELATFAQRSPTRRRGRAALLPVGRSRSRARPTTARSRSPIARPRRAMRELIRAELPDHGIDGEEFGSERARRRAGLAPRPDRRHQVLHHRAAAVRHADRPEPRRAARSSASSTSASCASAGSAPSGSAARWNGEPIRVRACADARPGGAVRRPRR